VNQAYRRSSHSEGTEVRTGLCGRLKSRTHTRVESGATPLRGAEALGSDASVHGGAEAVPWNQAPGCQSGLSYFEHLRNLQRPATSSTHRSGRRPRVELASHRGGGLARRCRSVVAEATCERLPIAACRGRLTFGGVDLSGLRRGRAPRLPACPGSRGKRAGRRATEEPVSR
jgi:hypothetical protein